MELPNKKIVIIIMLLKNSHLGAYTSPPKTLCFFVSGDHRWVMGLLINCQHTNVPDDKGRGQCVQK